jgi:hypothetical protein
MRIIYEPLSIISVNLCVLSFIKVTVTGAFLSQFIYSIALIQETFGVRVNKTDF